MPVKVAAQEVPSSPRNVSLQIIGFTATLLIAASSQASVVPVLLSPLVAGAGLTAHVNRDRPLVGVEGVRVNLGCGCRRNAQYVLILVLMEASALNLIRAHARRHILE